MPLAVFLAGAGGPGDRRTPGRSGIGDALGLPRALPPPLSHLLHKNAMLLAVCLAGAGGPGDAVAPAGLA